MRLLPSPSISAFVGGNWVELRSEGTTHTLPPGAGDEVKLRIHGTSFDPSSPTAPVKMHTALPTGTKSVDVEVDGGTQAEVVFRGNPAAFDIHSDPVKPGRLVLATNNVRTLKVRTVTVRLDPGPSGAPQIAFVSCADGNLELAHVSVMDTHLTGKVTFSLQSSKVGKLSFERGSSGHISTSGGSVTALSLIGAGNQQPDVPDITLLGQSHLLAETMESVKIVVTAHATLTAAQSASDLTIWGRGHFHVSRFARDITFRNEIKLTVSEHAQLFGAGGAAILRDVRAANIVGNAAFAADADLRFTVSDVETTESLTDVSLDQVNFPQSSRGLRVIKALTAEARHVTPAISQDLPGWARRYRAFRPRAPEDGWRFETLYADALAGLASAKASAASERSILAWSSYRMRNLTANSKMERGVLSAYRLIGYGERFLPAFATFFAVATILTVASLIGDPLALSREGVGNVIAVWSDWLLSPAKAFGVAREVALNRTDNLQLLLRVLVSIPFITGFICLRKYAKGGNAPAKD